MPTEITIKLEGLEGVMETLRSLPAEVVSRRGGPVRTALRKGALVIHKQAKANLARATANATTDEERRNTGLLEKNLVVQRGKPPAGINGEVFLVRVRRKKYDRPTQKKATTTIKAGSLLEYGSSQQPAEPWLRPAASAKAQEAMQTVVVELKRALDRAVKKASKGKASLT